MGDIDINNLGLSKMSRTDIEQQFANDKRLDKILLIFDKINALDNEIGDTLSSKDIFGMRRVRYANFSNGEPQIAFLENKSDNIVTDYELSKYFSKAKVLYGEEVELEDYKKFLGFMASKGDKAYLQKLEECASHTGLTKEVIEKLGGVFIAEEYKLVTKNGTKYLERTCENFTELRDVTGELLELREKNCAELEYEGLEKVTRYNEDGTSSEHYINNETGEQTRFDYGKTPEDKAYKIHVKDGIAIKQSHSPDDTYWKDFQLEDIVFGAGSPDSTKVSFKYDENNQFVGLEIKDENSKGDVPRGFTTDGNTYLTYIPKQTNVDSNTIKTLKQMIDGGARYGEDFDLKIENGQLKVVPKIKNETEKETPELRGAAFDKYKNLIGKGIHAGEDFDVEYDDNGNFRYNYKNNQSKGYEADYKTEIYDKNGNFVSSLIVKNGEIIRESILNGTKQTNVMSFDDAFIQLLAEKNFVIAGEILGNDDILSGGYNIYPPAEKYKQLIGRELIEDVYEAINNAKKSNNDKNIQGLYNLMSKLQPHGSALGDTKEAIIENYKRGYNEFRDILNFNPKNSSIANLLPQVKRTQKNEFTYSEQVNNDIFDVNYTNDKISISKNGTTNKTLDVSTLPKDYVKNVLMNLPTSVLYDMASNNIKLELDDRINDGKNGGRTNGYYTNADNGKIVLDPNAVTGNRAIETIVHESGHMCDHINSKENAMKSLVEQMKDPLVDLGRDKAVTVNDLLEERGILQPVSNHDLKLKEIFDKEFENYIKNPPNVNINSQYALTNKMEFFAEAYTLLNLGSCKSEYIIANYFPETLVRVNEIINENRIYREK